MRVSRTLLLGLALGATVQTMAAAAERKACLSQEERRAALNAHKAVPLAHAMHVVKAKVPGEVVKARLCQQERGLFPNFLAVDFYEIGDLFAAVSTLNGF